jgi:hypothetical protein
MDGWLTKFLSRPPPKNLALGARWKTGNYRTSLVAPGTLPSKYGRHLQCPVAILVIQTDLPRKIDLEVLDVMHAPRMAWRGRLPKSFEKLAPGNKRTFVMKVPMACSMMPAAAGCPTGR